jgi:hypothetical protein
MPYPLSVLPDGELALVQYLGSVAEVVALVPGTRITTQLAPKPTYPVVLISRAGGPPVVWQAIDEPVLQVDVLGVDKASCSLLMRTVAAAILAIRNDVVAEAVLVSGIEEIGPAWLPDMIPINPIPRYVARFRVLLHK